MINQVIGIDGQPIIQKEDLIDLDSVKGVVSALNESVADNEGDIAEDQAGDQAETAAETLNMETTKSLTASFLPWILIGGAILFILMLYKSKK
jgi:hypothetical protein